MDTHTEIETENETINQDTDLQAKLLEEADNARGNEQFNLELDYADQKEKEDREWQERTGLNEDTLCGAIETILFMSDRPIKITRIRDNIDEQMPLRVIHDSLSRLQEEYESKHHGIRLLEVGEGYQFRTKATYAKYVQDLFKVNSIVLSPTALEVLAIVAYKQPVSRNVIDKIRGVDSSHILRALMDKRLVKVVGRSEEMGRPVVYGTTVEFLEMFSISSLEELPPEHELETLAENQNVGEISDIKNLVTATEEMKEKFSFDDLEEIDELGKQIKSISTETSFTLGLKEEEKKKNSDEETGPKKTAFELLEEFVLQREEPECDGDLETATDKIDQQDLKVIGELRREEPLFPEELEDDLEISTQEQDSSLDNNEEGKETLLSDNDREKAELEKALDEAFEKLTLQDEMEFEALELTENTEVSEDDEDSTPSTLN